MRNRIGARKNKASSGSSILRNGSLTGCSKKRLLVRHRARGDRKIEQDEQIGEPEAPADRRRVVHRLLDRLEVVGLGGDRREAGRRRAWRPRRGRVGCSR